MWNTKKGDCVKTLRGHTNLVAAICFSPNGREAASGSDDRSVRLWDLQTGKMLPGVERPHGKRQFCGLFPRRHALAFRFVGQDRQTLASAGRGPHKDPERP